jgi:alkylhydroperoxidase/carboxymuconolactone decarboxylase family protein YurZ
VARTSTKPEARRISEKEMSEAWAYAEDYYKNPQVMADYELLSRYRPEVFHGYITLRRAAFNEEETAALTPKMKELIILAIEIARTKTNPPPVGHAKRAVDSGATPAEIAEVASLCILIGGMLTYQESGRHALRAAEERYSEKNGGGAAKATKAASSGRTSAGSSRRRTSR